MNKISTRSKLAWIVFAGLLPLINNSCRKDPFLQGEIMVVNEPKSFERVFGSGGDDLGNSCVYADFSIYIAGVTTQTPGNADIYLLRIDTLGYAVFDRSFGGVGKEIGTRIIETNDNRLVICGITNSYGAGGYDCYVLKVDMEGNLLWHKTHGSVAVEYASDIIETADGGFLMLGTSRGFGNGSEDVYLVRMDSFGNLLWEKTYGGPANDGGTEIQATPEGNYLLFGYTESFGSGDRDYWLIKVNPDGGLLWSKTYGGGQYEESQSICSIQGGGYLLNGHSASTDISHNMYAIKLDADLNTVWERNMGGNSHDGGHSVVATDNQEYIFIGRSNSFNSIDEDIYYVMTNSFGNIVSEETFGGTGDDRGYDIVESESAFYIVGETNSYRDEDYDVFLIKKSKE